MVYKRPFWDENKDIIAICQPNEGNDPNDQDNYKNTRGRFYQFWNVSKAVGKPCLIGIVTGEAAVELSNETDDMIVETAQSCIETVYSDVRDATLIESIVTRWQVDPFTRGSYSYVGLEATPADYDLLSKPVCDSLFFAGEATCRAYPATVHGAYISGLRAASEILESLIGEIKIPQPLVPSKDYQANKRMIQQNIAGAVSSHVTPTSSMVHTPSNQPIPVDPVASYASTLAVAAAAAAAAAASNINSNGHYQEYDNGNNNGDKKNDNNSKYHNNNGNSNNDNSNTDSDASYSGIKRKNQVEESEYEIKLRKLKEERQMSENEAMRQEMIKQLGKRPMKPERSGANPFLIFQKDFWEKCRKQCDDEKQKSSGDVHARAARNEVRAALGKMWRELPEAEKIPYLQQTKEIKESNTRKTEEYRELVRRYDTEADDFKKKWKEEHPSKPSEEELRLMKLIQEEKKQLQQQQQQQQQHNNDSSYSKGKMNSPTMNNNSNLGSNGNSNGPNTKSSSPYKKTRYNNI